jgi:predicted esterase
VIRTTRPSATPFWSICLVHSTKQVNKGSLTTVQDSYIVHAKDDKVVPIEKHSDVYVAHCRSLGLRVMYRVLESGGHGFGITKGKRVN